ncbi:peptide ABC transporter ATPase [Halogeometricum borinquense]|uniref:peptide ABC transporter ATPase n=1 Tax=Halogeometricum borinquense TaxID=60847 RepID=UPI00341F700A
MSTNHHPTTNAQTDDRFDDLESTLNDLESRLDDLEAENERLHRELDAKNERIEELEDDHEWLRNYVLDLEHAILGEWLSSELLAHLDHESIGDAVLSLSDSVETSQIDAIREKQITNHQSVKRDIARIKRQVTHLADETDIELLDSVPGDDKVAKVVKDGVASVESKVYGKHERAELVLQNLADWGTVKTDANGSAVLLHAGNVKERLETARNESLQSTQVKRVLDQIDDWTDDSTRYSKVKKTNGVWRLKLGIHTE